MFDVFLRVVSPLLSGSSLLLFSLYLLYPILSDRLYVCMYVFMYVLCMYICVYMYVCIYVCVFMYVCMHICMPPSHTTLHATTSTPQLYLRHSYVRTVSAAHNDSLYGCSISPFTLQRTGLLLVRPFGLTSNSIIRIGFLNKYYNDLDTGNV